MTTRTASTFFSGVGGACHGLKLAGYDVEFGSDSWDFVEPIWKSQNPSATFLKTDFLTLDPDSVPKSDLFWFSPPCQSFSIANPNRKETPKDLELSNKICELTSSKNPSQFVLENVRSYAISESCSTIKSCLIGLGYNLKQQIVNCADYGVPQNRYRYILQGWKEDHTFPEPVIKPHISWNSILTELDLNPDDYLCYQKKSKIGLGRPTNTITGSVLRSRVYLCDQTGREVLRLSNNQMARLQTLNPLVNWEESQKYSVAIGNAVPSLFVKNFLNTM